MILSAVREKSRIPVLGAAVLAVMLLQGCFEDQSGSRRSQTFDLQATVGVPLFLHLNGTPKRGNFWQLNADKSSGLGLIRLERLGWTFAAAQRGSASFTKPGILRYAVRPRRAGSTVLAFEYFRKEPGASASAIWKYRIDILPRTASR